MGHVEGSALSALYQACVEIEADADGARLLREHANAVYYLPGSELVARVSRPGADADQARTAVAVVTWLLKEGFPAVPLLDGIKQPVLVAGRLVTFWQYCPPEAGPEPTSSDLGHLVRRLHRFPQPPLRLAAFDPFTRVEAAVATAGHLLDPAQHRWLTHHVKQLRVAYADLDFPLGDGLIHADAHLGNLLTTPAGPVLGDWDQVCLGPREWDLTATPVDIARFNAPASSQQDVAAAYGYDITDWNSWPILRAIRELRMTAPHLYNAPHRPASLVEAQRRLSHIADVDLHSHWTAA